MSAPIHLAARQIQADTAGLTGASEPASVPTGAPAPTTITEAASHAIHTESGSLHFLFDVDVLRPVSTAVHATEARRGPNGGRVTILPGPAIPSGVATEAGTVARSAEASGGATVERAAATARGFAERIRAAFAPKAV